MILTCLVSGIPHVVAGRPTADLLPGCMRNPPCMEQKPEGWNTISQLRNLENKGQPLRTLFMRPNFAVSAMPRSVVTASLVNVDVRIVPWTAPQ